MNPSFSCVFLVTCILQELPVVNSISEDINSWREPETCLVERTVNSTRFLVYPNGSLQSLSIPFPSWSSVQVVAHLHQILLSEVMKYSSRLYQLDTIDDSDVVRSVVGCTEIADLHCVNKNAQNPKIHLTLETWSTGNQLVLNLEETTQPILARTLDYAGADFLFLWQDTIEAGLNSPERLVLSHYHAYNANLNKPAKFFDRWEKILELLPEELIFPCSTVNPDDDNFDSQDYKLLTNDTGGCNLNDRVWFSPACRSNLSECVPVVIQYYASIVSQLAFFLHMPLAVVVVDRGQNNYFEYYDALQRGRFLFGYWWPNDRPVDRLGRIPEQLIFPRANLLEQRAGFYRTGPPPTKLYSYAWRGMARAAPQALFLATRLNLIEQDMQWLMEQSSLRKRAGGAAAEALAVRQVACEWVRANQARWAAWIPAECPSGTAPSPSLDACAPCPAGRVCPGGYEAPAECPAGFYCPGNSSSALLCPGGRGTPSPGASSVRSCTVCPSGSWAAPAGDGCVNAAEVLPAALLSATAGLLAVALLLRWLRRESDAAQWRIVATDIAYCKPEEVLGRGPHAVTVKAFRRGTPVAVKCFLPQGRSGDPGSGIISASGIGSSTHAHFLGMGVVTAGAGGPPSQRAVIDGVRLVSGLRHPSITAVMGVVLEPRGGDDVRVVMELMELGSLADLLPNRMFRCGAGFAARTLRSVSRGMRFLHEGRPPIPHGALHSGNILVDRHLCAKLSDVALRHNRGSASVEADILASGAVMYEIMARAAIEALSCGSGGIDRDSGGEMATAGQEQLPAVRGPGAPAGCSVDMAALISDCLCARAADRPTFGEIDRRLRAIPTRRVCSNAVPADIDTDEDEEDGNGGDGRGAASAGQQARPGALRGAWRRGSRVMASLFPPNVAAALVRGEKPAPEAKPMVTLFFSDIVGYTDLSAALSAAQVGDLLDRLFGRLDDAAELCGVSKVDTIGDAYLCATNLAGDQAGDHAARMARFAAAALRAARATAIDPADPARGCVQMRVGLHSGPCTAGVVGRRCPKYTLFGDTVNVAARMEQSGTPGRIQCTAFTADLIRAQDATAHLIRRGLVQVKGKGPMETYWIDTIPEQGAAAADPIAVPAAAASESRMSAEQSAVGPSPLSDGVVKEGSGRWGRPSPNAEAPWAGRWSSGSSRRVAPAELPDGPS